MVEIHILAINKQVSIRGLLVTCKGTACEFVAKATAIGQSLEGSNQFDFRSIWVIVLCGRGEQLV